MAEPLYRIVAIGKVINTPGDNTIHNVDIPLNHARVSIDVVNEGDANLPVSYPAADMMVVNDAVGSFVAWPIELIIVENMVRSSIYHHFI